MIITLNKINKLKLNELRILAKNKYIRGIYKYNKRELIIKILETQRKKPKRIYKKKDTKKNIKQIVDIQSGQSSQSGEQFNLNLIESDKKIKKPEIITPNFILKLLKDDKFVKNIYNTLKKFYNVKMKKYNSIFKYVMKQIKIDEKIKMDSNNSLLYPLLESNKLLITKINNIMVILKDKIKYLSMKDTKKI